MVYRDSKRCCCFTKSYYRYVKGTGSLLAKLSRLQTYILLLKNLNFQSTLVSSNDMRY
ncbi:hypothetical protein GLYMA_08G177700v4 [Glycine max]|uniref:Uncharacterized protein n=1 Tax=Glycine max TaxID=3847 RepID=A0A0R0INN0_SOYBN|nr:hypothetical protein GYH30_021592 [Glycine max]KRH43885.1 hypothetical protein GLYMA_08G177700v4 [Glycine max]